MSTKFQSKWTAGKPGQDIGGLKYPYTVLNPNSEPVGTVDSAEEGEELLDYLWETRPHADAPKLMVQGTSANFKLYQALRHKAEIDGAARKITNKKQAKADDKAERTAAKLDAELEDWLAMKQAGIATLLDHARRTFAMLDDLSEGDITDDTMQTLGQFNQSMGTLLGLTKNYHFGVTSSKMFARHKMR